jgi:hypothetical protein
MRNRFLIVFAVLVALLLPATPALADEAPRLACGPQITLTPPYGQQGTHVSVNVRFYPPDTDVTIILRIAGNPVLGTVTTDEEGRAYFEFTMPAFTGEYVNVFATAPPCNATGAHFFYRETTPTAVPTRTPPPAATSTPVPPTVPPTIRPTPPPPPAGTGLLTESSTGFNIALIAVALIVFSSGFAIWGSGRRRSQPMPVRIQVTDHIAPRALDDEGDPLSAEPRRASAGERHQSNASLIAAGIGTALAGVLLLLRGKKDD